MERDEILRHIKGAQAHWQSLQAEIGRITEEARRDSSRKGQLNAAKARVQQQASDTLDEINRLKAML